MRFRLNSLSAAAAAALLLVLFSSLGWLLYQNIAQWRRAEGQIKHTEASTRSAEQIYALELSAESAVRRYVITGDQAALAPFNSALNALEREINLAARFERTSPEHKNSMEGISTLVARRKANFQETILLRRSSGFDSARMRTLTGAGSRLTEELRTATKAFSNHNRDQLTDWEFKASTAAMQRDSLLTTTFLILFLLVAAALTAALHTARRRRLAEEGLADANARLQGVLDSATQLAIIATDLEGRITLFNSGAEKMLGYTAAEMLGRTPDIIHSAAEMELRGAELSEILKRPVQGFDIFVQAARQGGYENREWTYVRKNGSGFPVELVVTGVKDHQGKLTGFLGLATDISARKKSQQQMRKLSAAVKHSPTSIVITDKEGSIEYGNPKFFELTGYTESEMVGQNPRLISSGKMPKEIYKDLWDTLLAGREWQGELLNKKKTGELFWEHASISPVKDPNGNITHFVAVKMDITDRKLAQREIEKARDTALELARLKSEFLANMSHEIRTPMNAIIGMTGLLLDTPLNAQQRDYVKTVNGAGEALLDIINDILDFSKIESGKLHIEKLDFDLRETVESTADLLAPRAQSKGLELACLIEPEVPPHLRGDQGRLRQILLNLLGNAIKFTAAGEVVLKVSSLPGPAGGTTLKFSIRDTGIGIPAETQKNLFQVFTQADSSTTRKYGGTGLGLSISKKLAGLMGGEIGLESEPGKGSTFWFTLPFEPATLPAPAERQELELSGVKTLIIDDNSANREIVSRYLADWRMRFETAASAEEALLRLRRDAGGPDPFRLALLDMQMPGMDGLMLARAMRDDAALAGVRKVMMTSLGHDMRPEELAEAAIAVCLSKPVRTSALFNALSSALGGPVNEPAALPRAAAARPRNPYFRVLVAEDNIVNQKVAVRQLEKLGYDSDVAANGLEALEAMKRWPYDLVLMDCQMPEMDGYQATAEIRKGERDQRHTPVVAMTADALQGDREKCLAAGMDGYIPKPVRIEQLDETLAQWDTPLSPAVLRDLAELAGPENPDFLKEIIAAYLKDLPGRLEAMRAAFAAGAAPALQQAAHALKGSSGNVGAQRLYKICRMIEDIAKGGSAAGAGELLLALEAEAPNTRAAMEAAAAGAPPEAG